MSITCIEILFAIPVELTDDERRKLHDLISSITRRTQPDGYSHWLAGCGSKPHFSESDSAFLGKPEDSLGPPNGEEPTWDDNVYSLETCCLEKVPPLAHHPECPCSFSESRFVCNCPYGWPK